jgi:nucleotide-binding universal stress UspA family protein
MNRPKKILVAYDGSAHSKEALSWAVDLSVISGAPVIAVKVVEPVEMNRAYALYEAGYGATLAERFDEMRKLDAQQMKDAMDAGKRKGVEVKTEMLRGNVAAAIIDYADKNGADLIVAGTKGHGALAELLMGSVTRNLVSLSHLPVLVVKSPEE